MEKVKEMDDDTREILTSRAYDALAADAALTPEQRAMFNAIHDALSTGIALATGSVSEQATRNVRDAGDRAHSDACAVVVANRRAAR